MQVDSRIIQYIRSERLKTCYRNVIVVSDLFNVPRSQVKEIWKQETPEVDIRQPYKPQTAISDNQLEMLKSLYRQGCTPKTISKTLSLPLKPVQNMVRSLVNKGILPERRSMDMPEQKEKME